MSKPSCAAKLQCCLNTGDYRAETSSSMGGNKRVNYTLDSSPLSTRIVCSVLSVFRSEICLLSRHSVHTFPDTCQNSDSWLGPKISWQVWIRRENSTELRERKHAGRHADGKTPKPQRPRGERSNPCRASNQNAALHAKCVCVCVFENSPFTALDRLRHREQYNKAKRA